MVQVCSRLVQVCSGMEQVCSGYVSRMFRNSFLELVCSWMMWFDVATLWAQVRSWNDSVSW